MIRRLAREYGINLDRVKGTGRKGRVVKEDIQAYVKPRLKHLKQALYLLQRLVMVWQTAQA